MTTFKAGDIVKASKRKPCGCYHSFNDRELTVLEIKPRMSAPATCIRCRKPYTREPGYSAKLSNHTQVPLVRLEHVKPKVDRRKLLL